MWIKEYKKAQKDMPGVKEYVDKKHEYTKLLKDLKNWNWKIEIAEVAAKQAQTKLRWSGMD